MCVVCVCAVVVSFLLSFFFFVIRLILINEKMIMRWL